MPRRLLVAVVLGVIAGAIFAAAGQFGWFNDDPSDDSTGDNALGWAIEVVVILIAAAVVLWFGKRALDSGRVENVAVAALVFGALALLSFPAFWLGIYWPLAAGGVVLGIDAHQRGVVGSRRIMAYAGIALAVVAVVFCGLLNLFG
ncbi:MAG: hypothetical protein ACR2HN_14190 [Tepidiformaceae bacterium]